MKSITASGTISNEANNVFRDGEAQIKTAIDSIKVEIKNTQDEEERRRLTDEMNRVHRRLYAELHQEIIEEFPASILAVEFLSAGIGNLDYTGLKEHMTVLDPGIVKNWYLDRLIHRLDILNRTQVGKILPDFTMLDVAGQEFTLSSLRGSYVLIDFWASWCKPCRAENVNVKALYEQYHDKGFDVVGVSIDSDRENWVKAIQDDKLPWHQVSSLTGWKCEVSNKLGVAYGMSGVPYTILIDREGKVVGHNLRGGQLADRLANLL